ncbi:hypothetical protein ABID82_002265 [Methylobacterium sp. PvP062]
MHSAASITLPILGALVERASRRAGSRMSAYDDVGRTIGETGSWVRKFLGRQPVRLDADTYLAIKAAYARECERLEAEAATERARFFALGGRLDAMASTEARSARLETSGNSSGARSPAPLVVARVAPVVDEKRR